MNDDGVVLFDGSWVKIIKLHQFNEDRMVKAAVAMNDAVNHGFTIKATLSSEMTTSYVLLEKVERV